MNCSRSLALVALLAGAAAAQNFQLDIAENSNIPVPAGNLVPVNVVYLPGDAAVKSIRILASRFASDQDSINVDILASCDPNATAETQPAAFTLQDGKTASLCLRIPPLSTDGKYAGSLSIFPDNNKPEAAKHFSLSRPAPPPATLTTDRQTLTVQLQRPLLGMFPSFDHVLGSVELLEKSGKGAANGISVQADSGLKGPGSFDPAANLLFQWNGQPWPSPFSTGPAVPGQSNAANVTAGSQAQIIISGKGLHAGEYIIPLHFAAPGASSDSAKLAMTIDVRDSVWLAIAVLLGSLLLSYLITKVLLGKQRRIDLMQQIDDVRVSKGTTLPNLPAVVWVGAVLNLAERLSKRFWLSGADVIAARLDTVRATASILKQARELLAILQRRLPKLVYNRVVETLDGIVCELGMEPPDEALASRIKNELVTFNDWLQEATLPAALWRTILPSLEGLKRTIESGTVPDSAKEAIQKLKSTLDSALGKPPTSLEEIQDCYRVYARLRMYWDARNEPGDLAQLIAEPDLEDCFRVNDSLAWNHLKKELQDNKATLKLHMPAVTDTGGLEAFTPLLFWISVENSKINGTYLFRRKVEYAWRFVLTPNPAKWHEKLRRKRREAVVLTPVTAGPSVAQYFPSAGKTKISATLTHCGDSIKLSETNGPDIRDYAEFGILKTLAGVSNISTLIAMAVALATGLATFYFKNATFGSFQDYVTMALWGAGMDQGKNFIQALQSTQPSRSAPAK